MCQSIPDFSQGRGTCGDFPAGHDVTGRHQKGCFVRLDIQARLSLNRILIETNSPLLLWLVASGNVFNILMHESSGLLYG